MFDAYMLEEAGVGGEARRPDEDRWYTHTTWMEETLQHPAGKGLALSTASQC